MTLDEALAEIERLRTENNMLLSAFDHINDNARKGGMARTDALTAAERSELGRKAAASRWNKTSPDQRREIARNAAAARWNKSDPAVRMPAGRQASDQATPAALPGKCPTPERG